jgi:hypothetical protein
MYHIKIILSHGVYFSNTERSNCNLVLRISTYLNILKQDTFQQLLYLSVSQREHRDTNILPLSLTLRENIITII